MGVVGRYRRDEAPRRVCATPGCRTVLSRYNTDRHCALHQAPEHPSVAANQARLPTGRRIP